jgi:Ankyrin repeats (3 copies)
MWYIKTIRALALITLCFVSLPLPAWAQGMQRSLNEDLMYRISFGRVDDVKTLLEKGAEPNIYGAMGDTPLILATSRNPGDADDIIKALLVKGADPNFPDKNGIYPLEVAIKHDRASLIKILIESGADIHIKMLEGMTMIDYANRMGKPEITQIMADQLKKEAEEEARLHAPARLLSLIHQFTTNVCEMSYWNNYLISEQNPKDNEMTREKVYNSKVLGEKVGAQIATYFPKVKLDSYINFSSTSITNVFVALRDNKTRAENGIGTDDDAHKRCQVIAEASRDSIARVLDEQQRAIDRANRQAELMR